MYDKAENEGVEGGRSVMCTLPWPGVEVKDEEGGKGEKGEVEGGGRGEVEEGGRGEGEEEGKVEVEDEGKKEGEGIIVSFFLGGVDRAGK